MGAAAEPLKSCNLCCAQYPRSEFKVLSGGRRASYCVKCTGYVCQGRTRRLSIHDLRRAMKNSELDTLLRGDSPLPADHKRCQLCAEVLEVANFRPLPRGGHESYCGTCSKYVRRGTKLGLNIEGVRKAREVRSLATCTGACFGMLVLGCLFWAACFGLCDGTQCDEDMRL